MVSASSNSNNGRHFSVDRGVLFTASSEFDSSKGVYDALVDSASLHYERKLEGGFDDSVSKPEDQKK
jgi:hypothetical protein